MKTPKHGPRSRNESARCVSGPRYLQTRIEREFSPGTPPERVGGCRARRCRRACAPRCSRMRTTRVPRFGGRPVLRRRAHRLGVGDPLTSRARGVNADAVIQESTIRYLKPVSGEFRAALKAPPLETVDKFPQDAGAFRPGAHPLAGGDPGRVSCLPRDSTGCFVAALRRGPAFLGEYCVLKTDPGPSTVRARGTSRIYSRGGTTSN